MKKTIIHNVSILVSGSVLAQVFQLLGQVLLSRIYSASQFGFLAQVVSIGSIISVVGTLQMHQAMVLPRNESKSAALFAIGMFSSSMISISSLLVMICWESEFFGRSASNFLPWSCAFLALLLCYNNLFRGWQTARGKFKILSLFSVVHAVCIIGFQSTIGLIKIDYGLIIGILIGEFATSLLFVLFKVSPKLSCVFQVLIQPIKIYKGIKEYYQFSCTGTIQELVSASVLVLPLFMFSRIYGSEVGGQYAMASRFAWAPLLLVGGALTQVSFHAFSGLNANEFKTSPVLQLDFKKTVILFAGIVGAILFSDIFLLIFGHKWELASNFGGWILLWATAFFLSIPYRVCCRILRWQSLQLITDSLVLVCLLTIFLKSDQISPLSMMSFVAWTGIIQNLIIVVIVRLKLYLK